jgi:hypothetical protein
VKRSEPLESRRELLEPIDDRSVPSAGKKRARPRRCGSRGRSWLGWYMVARAEPVGGARRYLRAKFTVRCANRALDRALQGPLRPHQLARLRCSASPVTRKCSLYRRSLRSGSAGARYVALGLRHLGHAPRDRGMARGGRL